LDTNRDASGHAAAEASFIMAMRRLERVNGRRKRSKFPPRVPLRVNRVCVPTSLSQEVGAALGAQAGEAKLREVIAKGDFTRIRRAMETPFNMILEARP
jgi:hypothetical protein